MASVPPDPPVPPTSPTITPAAPVPDPDAALKTRKLELEIQQLQRATSEKSWTLELLKTWAPLLTAIVAIGALIWSINAGVKQANLTQSGQDQERFDKALSRLGTASISERLTGVAGLSLFLTPDQRSRHAATLRFLATALVIEPNPNVRQAILDTFSHMDPAIVRQDAREDGLRTLLDLNRSTRVALLRSSISQSDSSKAQESGQVNSEESLQASAMAIVIFVKKGTDQRDFSGIDCTDCDFSGASPPLDLSNSTFDRAVLTNAKFSGLKLTGSSFDGAYLAGTNFEGADLKRARFTGTPHESYAVQQFIRTGEKPRAPDFACADATEADFSGSLFFGVIESNVPNERIAGYPDLFQTNLNRANLSKIGMYALPAAHSKSGLPFTNSKIISYRAPSMSSHGFAVMRVAESSDWRFVPSSPGFQTSWRYLLGQLQLARGTETANFSMPMDLKQGLSSTPADQNRCDQYRNRRYQGQ
jgi:uncharacterized protein YjbI with pentapeptide repeats